MNDVLKAARLARYYHRNQYRKWPDRIGIIRPYITHPARVASSAILNQEYFDGLGVWMEDIVSAAWLHDVLEDCRSEVNEFLLKELIHDETFRIVTELTNDEHPVDMVRIERKAKDNSRLSRVSPEAKILKALDRLDNLSELISAPTEFIKKYCDETCDLMRALGDDVPPPMVAQVYQEVDRLRRFADRVFL